MITLEADADIFEQDFGVTATFTIDGDEVEITGAFTNPTDATTLYGQVEVIAQNPSLTFVTSKIVDVKTKMKVEVLSKNYRVEKIDDVGTGHSVVWLKGLTS